VKPIKKDLFRLLEKLLNSKQNFLINRLIPHLVPFNYGHHISIKSRSYNEVTSHLPKIKRNLNHIKTIHACAIATLGEFSAGILLLHHFPLSENRIIMKKLTAEYHMQAKTNLESIARLPDLKTYQSELLNNHVTFIPMEVHVYNIKKELVATITTIWQIKSWDKVKLS
jgi:hypothetical protein